MKTNHLAALCATGLITIMASVPAAAQTEPTQVTSTISDAECDRLLADENALVTMPQPETVPIWDVGVPSTPTPSPSGTPTPGSTPTPSPSPSPSPTTVFGPNDPVVQPLPTPTPTPTPSPTTPVVTPPTGGGTGSAAYAKVGTTPISGTNKTYTLNGQQIPLTVWKATSLNSAYKQDLATTKTYPTPSGGGILKTVAGQKVLVKGSDVDLDHVDSNLKVIFDEIYIVANLIGMNDPVFTAGEEQDGHTPGSKHYTGDALDMRCNTANGYSTTTCKNFVGVLAQALGPRYGVQFENYGTSRDHIHISWLG